MMDDDDIISVALAGSRGAFALDAQFAVPASGITGLFGPSGSGKTTLLRAIAGLERLLGSVKIGGEIWQDSESGQFLAPHKRHVGYVFQEASLFAHLSVADNLMFGARRIRREEMRAPALALSDVVELLGLQGMLARHPGTLSGGERQRVAIGRALLSGPRVLLMDEPLAALDARAKDEIIPYLESLRQALDVPVLYVSHDRAEVERLADTLVLLDGGRVVASGALQDLQTNTALPLLALPGASTTLVAQIMGHDVVYQLTRFAIDGGELVGPGVHGAIGETRRLRVAASDVSLVLRRPDDSTIVNTLAAMIEAITADPAQPYASVVVRLGAGGAGSRVVARITRKSLDRLSLVAGARVYAQIKGVALVASGPEKSTAARR